MADLDAQGAKPIRVIGLVAALSASLMLGACAQIGGEESASLFGAVAPETKSQAEQAPSDPQQATEYWGKIYTKNPRDLDAALAYAQNLKLLGQKREALAVLQQASFIHSSDRRLAADYGRLALELDQVSVAKKLLEIADDPGQPDWRIIMARGTALAKEGSYRDAIPFYERALVLNPGNASVLNNLALAYTMSGEPDRGEKLLRQASETGDNAKVRQNLAMVLGLQGKYDEATKVGSVDLAEADAQANTSLLKKMVKLDAKSMPASLPSGDSWSPTVATSTPAVASPTVDSPAVVPAKGPDGAASSDAPVLRASTVETGSAASATRRASDTALRSD